MAGDVKIVWDLDTMEGDFDYEYLGGDLTRDAGLETALIISLFTDRRARIDDELPDKEGTRRGWWGDKAVPEVEGDEIGSRLWLLERSKTVEESLVRAKEYIKEGIQWLIDDGVAEKIDISVERVEQDNPTDTRMYFDLKVYKKDGTTEAYRFESNWDSQVG